MLDLIPGKIVYQSAIVLLPSGLKEDPTAKDAPERAFARVPTWTSGPIDIEDAVQIVRACMLVQHADNIGTVFLKGNRFDLSLGIQLVADGFAGFLGGIVDEGGNKADKRKFNYYETPLPLFCEKCQALYYASDKTAPNGKDYHEFYFGHPAAPRLPAKRQVTIMASCCDSPITSEVWLEVI